MEKQSVTTEPEPPVGEPRAESRPAGRFSHAWRALRHRNFRLYFTGQSISLIGTWMTRIATGWLVYRLTGSALLLGVVGFAGQLPTFLLAPFAGVWIDRIDRRSLLVWTQALAAVQSLAVAGLTLAHIITIPELIGLSIFQGVINAFDMPGRQAALVMMVDDRESLRSAIALNSSMVNVARLIGPALAGLIIAWIGEGLCFLIDGASYLAVIVSLLMMRLGPESAARRGHAGMLAQLADGWTYVRGFMPIRTILLLFATLSLMGYPYMVLMPIFASQVLHGFFYGITIPLLWAMIADVADYSEWKNNRRATAIICSAMILGLKFGLAVGGALVAKLLDIYGYVRGAAEQTPQLIEGVKLAISVYAALPFFVCCVLLFWYEINKAMESRIEGELGQRRQTA